MSEITTVKIQHNYKSDTDTGYLVNDSMSVPMEESNRHYQMVQEWIAEGNTPEAADPAPPPSRKELVSQIKVTVDGMEFDGDEISQTRMARAVASSSAGETTQWKLADNTVATVTHEQLKQALRLAGEAQTALWMA